MSRNNNNNSLNTGMAINELSDIRENDRLENVANFDAYT